MMLLIRVFKESYHAVERDLLTMGYTVDDIGPKLSVWQLISIVKASPPGSAVFHAENKGWDRASHLLANLGEQQAGLMNLKSRHPRPGVDYYEPQRLSSDEQPYKAISLQ